MGLFDFLKSKKDKPGQNQSEPKEQTDIDRFETEIHATVARYISMPGASVDIKARHLETNEVMPFALGFPEPFAKWRSVKSLADRRGIIYALLDDQMGNQLDLWQVMERYNDDRYPQRALEIATKYKAEQDDKNPNFWNALARTHFILTDYEEAERDCEKALALDSSSIRSRRIWADILHWTGREDQAHEIYLQIMTEKIPRDKEISLAVQDLLGFDGDIVNSPIYAVGWLQSNEKATEEIWGWANEEFYYSPHFRSQYAYRLIKKGESLKGFAKLLALSKEMPWFREAVINSVSLIDQLKLTDQLQADKEMLEKIIRENNWTQEGMHRL